MAQLPIKRGLSKYYGGKSESFTSLASVERIEDLPKRENRCRKKKMKLCDSYDGGFDGHKFQSPKATINRKSSSRGSALPTMARNDLIHSCRPPHLPVFKHF
ncbi:hypothetical protein Nepgr_005186 [Nepenthes gracilis]|uniref:Uncharacterized protein n=1 Tax=Nepenthes gracilis TaxID=150966 RepID=A0AAD3S353_NEPGR|nr:hypothetical protein Nepgr_005186 [Nepenthes gracilis]